MRFKSRETPICGALMSEIPNIVGLKFYHKEDQNLRPQMGAFNNVKQSKWQQYYSLQLVQCLPTQRQENNLESCGKKGKAIH